LITDDQPGGRGRTRPEAALARRVQQRERARPRQGEEHQNGSAKRAEVGDAEHGWAWLA
jgi:hypothetical protein